MDKHRFTAVYYSDMSAARPLLSRCAETAYASVRASGGRMCAVTLGAPSFHLRADETRRLDGPRGHAMLFSEALEGLRGCGRCEPVFLVEHDVLYPAAYFAYMLAVIERGGEGIYFNHNVYTLSPDGFFRLPAAHLLSNCAGTCGAMTRALEGRRDAAIRGELRYAEPCVEDGFVARIALSPAPTVDVRHGRNFTGMRRPRIPADTLTEIPVWGAASYYDQLFAK
jgi:hypothetical protein